ncbi:site-specific integrase [Neobacillus terrae]|uniref:site-specific integrase n=1 Tax=Neobacillus terrae TaxID=3034837 RepID=UPI00140AA91D|nr:site-specific integrase [Neobacillus terrae]NHM33565.1 site-specific integrase [Neobacillus terrae]
MLLFLIVKKVRRGEVLGLMWPNVDFDAGTIHIQRSLTRVKEKGLILKDVKTESSNRIVVVSDYILDILRNRKEFQEKQKQLLGPGYQDQGLINCLDDGKPQDPRNLLRQFYGLLKEAGLPKFTFHQLRHLHATVLMAMGENPKIVAERLGHSRVQVTLDTYSHVSTEMQRQSANRFEQMMLKE